MARVALGDSRAFGRLYDRHRSRLFTFLARMTGDRALAEDLLQETFLRLWRRRETYEPSGRFRSWLFTIARRLALDHHRGGALEREAGPAGLDQLVAPDRPEARAESRELLARLEAALAALPPGQREIVLMSRYAGMDAEEIAAAVGSTAGAVRVALHRALQGLRGALAADAEPR